MAIAEKVLSWFTSLNSILNQCNTKITEKNGTAASDYTGLPNAIDTISAGTDTSDATATSENILEGKTAYISTGVTTGTMTDNGAVALTIDGINNESATIPSGYHNGSGTVSMTNDIKDEVSTQKTIIEEITTILDTKANAYPTISFDSSTGTLTITEV